jgi:hypothetical protein
MQASWAGRWWRWGDSNSAPPPGVLPVHGLINPFTCGSSQPVVTAGNRGCPSWTVAARTQRGPSYKRRGPEPAPGATRSGIALGRPQQARLGPAPRPPKGPVHRSCPRSGTGKRLAGHIRRSNHAIAKDLVVVSDRTPVWRAGRTDHSLLDWCPYRSAVVPHYAWSHRPETDRRWRVTALPEMRNASYLPCIVPWIQTAS